MIEEQGRVVAIEHDAVWVETVRVSACQSCSANKGCGHAVVDRQQAGSRARVRALNQISLELGQQVVLGLPEGALMRGALMIYFLPLCLLFAGALTGDAVSGSTGSAIGGVVGLVAGFVLNRWFSKRHQQDPAWHPTVLRRV